MLFRSRDFVRAVLYPQLEPEPEEDAPGPGSGYGYEGYELEELSEEIQEEYK